METKEQAIHRLMKHVSCEPNSGCWLWTGADSGGPDPYGKAGYRGESTQAYKLMYVLHKGEVPDGLELDHLCRVHLCVNPDHLEPVTHKVNMQRAGFYMKETSYLGHKTHCPFGHEYTPENTARKVKKGYMSRDCNRCDHRRQVLKRIKQGKPVRPETLLKLGIVLS